VKETGSINMLVKVNSVALVGLETVPVEVEVDVANQGFPGFNIVGLASKAIEESRERVKTAITNSGLDFPPKKITVNLAPADLPKGSTAYDLPMAIGILAASSQIPPPANHSLFYGELSLDGQVRATKGVLLVGMHAAFHSQNHIFVPIESATEGAVVSGITIHPVRNLPQLVDHLNSITPILPLTHLNIETIVDDPIFEVDLAEIAGQESAKRALVISASGGHNLLMYGPPGTGKTMLAKSLPSILPPLSPAEALEVTRIYSSAGLLNPGESLIRRRPYRHPHHGVSPAGMVGGGSNPTPGEVSLAHLGVLFLDEMPEFPRSVLEMLRQPIEDRTINIIRASAHVRYPASFTLVAAVNPCPCGFLGHPTRQCKCTDKLVRKYRSRLSGPILDRIDLHVQVPAVDIDKLTTTNRLLPTSKMIREKVVSTRKIQLDRFSSDGIYTNSQMSNKLVKKYCLLPPEAQNLLKVAMEKFDLSARTYFRLIKVARTIADLDSQNHITASNIAEALQYRPIA
jgi:magnesium chelatase family protein